MVKYELRPKKQLAISKVVVYEISTRNKTEPERPKKQLRFTHDVYHAKNRRVLDFVI